MVQSLPETDEQLDHKEPTTVETPAGWVAPTAYDYTAMADASASTTWDGNARVYQFTEEFGEIGPAHPELELELFGDPGTRMSHAGAFFAK